jgi:DNA-binding response OmpR family regulator
MARTEHSAGVLVVEDDPIVAMDLLAMLADLGFGSIFLAHDLATGMALLVSKLPGLGILDVNIGGELVFPLAIELRARGIPIIFSTGRAPTELPVEWTAHPILPKPLTAAILAAALDGLSFR